MTEEKVNLMTVVLVYDKTNQRILLPLKIKKDGFGEGRYNGYGGKFDPKEDKNLEATARREFNEESTAKALELEKKGIINFRFSQKPGKVFRVNIYEVLSYEGEVQETEEMRPFWFKIEDIPYDKMWAADCEWMPYFLEGKKFTGNIYFEHPKTDVVLGKNIKIVDDLAEYEEFEEEKS